MSDSPLRIVPSKPAPPLSIADAPTKESPPEAESSTGEMDELRRLLLEPEQLQLSNILERLNNPRVRDVYAQMGLKRNGTDLPDAYLVPEVNRALAEEMDMARLYTLLAEERAKKPEFAEWLDARFVAEEDEAQRRVAL